MVVMYFTVNNIYAVPAVYSFIFDICLLIIVGWVYVSLFIVHVRKNLR